jgi:predicted amidohydrolase
VDALVKKLKIACLQLNSQQSVSENISVIKSLALQAIQIDAVHAIALPENAFCHPYDAKYQPDLDQALAWLQAFARENKLWIFGGSIPTCTEEPGDKVYSVLNVINDKGEVVSRYKKIHLFDVHVQEENIDYRESYRFAAGNEVVVVDTPWGKIGLAICYDLRFPELFLAMESYEPFALVIPSAFTLHTGKKHWQHLLSARAVDNFAWIVAPNQTGMHPGGRSTFGHTSIVNPNGDIVAQIEDGVGYICLTINDSLSRELRSHIPLAQHRKL